VNQYQALESIWNGKEIYAQDDMGTMYKFKRDGEQFKYTRKGIDEWFNSITVTEFMTQFKNFTDYVLVNRDTLMREL